MRRKQTSPVNAFLLAWDLQILGQNLVYFQRKGEAAEPVLRECLKLWESVFGGGGNPNEWQVFQSRSLVGESLLLQGKYAEAEPLIVQSYEDMRAFEANYPSYRVLPLSEFIMRAVNLYNGWNKPDEANKWRQKLPVGTPVAGPPIKGGDVQKR
jgi:hypothetical protein